MLEDTYPVQWMGRQAVVTLPEHIDVSNTRQISEQLLSVINRGASELVVDMAATVSCDHAGADALVRAYQRAMANGTQLRLVVTARIVRRVLTTNGLDRLISVYPSLEAATAAATPAGASPGGPGPAMAQRGGARRAGGRATGRRGRPGAVAITQALLWQLIDALTDGVALTDHDGALVLVNRRLEEMFGYERGELADASVESLTPLELRDAHRSHRADYAEAPKARPMGAGARLVGLRKDGTTFPVEISLNPVPTATGHLTLAVVRDAGQARARSDLADLARAAAAAHQAHGYRELLEDVVHSLFDVGLSLQAAVGQSHHEARHHITQALQRLDDTVHQIRDHVFTSGSPPPGRQARPDGPTG